MDCLTSALNICPICSNIHSNQLTESGESAKVTSISEVNGKVVITLDNGTYLEADKSVVDGDLNANLQTVDDVETLKTKVEALEAKEDKDTIYDDSELKTKLAELETKINEPKENNNPELEERIAKLEELLGTLIVVESLSGNAFKAFPLN